MKFVIPKYLDERKYYDTVQLSGMVQNRTHSWSQSRKKVIDLLVKSYPKPTQKKMLSLLKYFVPYPQLDVVRMLTRGEEGRFFSQKIRELYETINTMPKIYETQNQGDEAIVHLHYFGRGYDLFITERDTSLEQKQAFGYTYVQSERSGFLAYVDVNNFIQFADANLDLHWKTISLKECKNNLFTNIPNNESNSVTPNVYNSKQKLSFESFKKMYIVRQHGGSLNRVFFVYKRGNNYLNEIFNLFKKTSIKNDFYMSYLRILSEESDFSYFRQSSHSRVRNSKEALESAYRDYSNK